jgi:hypothetical protein
MEDANIEEMTYVGLREALGEIADRGPTKEQAALIEAWNDRWAGTRGKFRWDPPLKAKKA